MTFTATVFADDPAVRDKAHKALEYLGPWCSRCGKKGQNCSTKRGSAARHACLVRQIGGAKGVFRPSKRVAA